MDQKKFSLLKKKLKLLSKGKLIALAVDQMLRSELLMGEVEKLKDELNKQLKGEDNV